MMTLIFFTLLFLVIDYYVFQAVKTISDDWTPLWRNIARAAFWVPTVASFAALLWWTFGDPYSVSAATRNWILTGLVATYFSKIFAVVFLFIDDLYRGIKWGVSFFYKGAFRRFTGRSHHPFGISIEDGTGSSRYTVWYYGIWCCIRRTRLSRQKKNYIFTEPAKGF
jgi:hypothetical protein